MSDAVLSRRARQDIREAVNWIARDNPVAARGLLRAVQAAARSIGEHPYSGVPRPELAEPDIRFLVLRGYPYLAVYNAEARPPRILRVLHGARDLPEVLQDLTLAVGKPASRTRTGEH